MQPQFKMPEGVDEFALNFDKKIAFDTKDGVTSTGVQEKRILIQNKERKFNFTRKWFHNRNLTTFSTFIASQFPPGRLCRAVQIGVFEGMDLVWQFQNTLAHPNSRCLAIDPWFATTKLDQAYMDAVHIRATTNLFPFRKKLELVQGKSQDVLRDYLIKPFSIANQHIPAGYYDYVIVDGDHDEDPVYQDAVLALQLVKVGGWLVFDDVRNTNTFKHHVKHGLEKFTAEYKDRVELVWFHRHMNCYVRTK